MIDPNNVLRTEDIDGTSVAIYIDEEGKFTARTPGAIGEWTKADSLKALIDKVRKRLRTSQLRLEIPMTLLKTGKDYWRDSEKNKAPVAEPVILTGLHARTNKALLTRADGSKVTYDGYSDGILTRRVSQEEATEWVATITALRQAEAAKDTLQKRLDRKGTLKAFIQTYVKDHTEATTGDLDTLADVEVEG